MFKMVGDTVQAINANNYLMPHMVKRHIHVKARQFQS